MRAARYFAAVDSHTEGMPTRVVTSGVDPIPGGTMLERKLYFEEHMDDLRLLLMREPLWRRPCRCLSDIPGASFPSRG